MRKNGCTAVRILIAEPSLLLRSGIRRLLEDEVDMEVVGEAADSVETIERTGQLRPDILLLDLAFWNFNDVDALPTPSILRSEAKIILLGGALDEKQVQQALECGARGVIGKGSSPELLIKSIRAVASGEYWFDRATLVGASKMRTATARAGAPKLTPREMEIVAEIMDGGCNARIAATLHISEETVKRHLANIYAKLGVSNRLELAMFAVGNRNAQFADA
jgi:two-component system, NarL family, nitrate/nitrite response regulator NarL